MSQDIKTISTSNLISSITDKVDGISKKATKEIIDLFIENIEDYVVQGHKVKIDKLGILQCKKTKARMGRNPKTGESIQIPASQKVTFKVASKFKDRVVKK